MANDLGVWDSGLECLSLRTGFIRCRSETAEYQPYPESPDWRASPIAESGSGRLESQISISSLLRAQEEGLLRQSLGSGEVQRAEWSQGGPTLGSQQRRTAWGRQPPSSKSIRARVRTLDFSRSSAEGRFWLEARVTGYPLRFVFESPPSLSLFRPVLAFVALAKSSNPSSWSCFTIYRRTSCYSPEDSCRVLRLPLCLSFHFRRITGVGPDFGLLLLYAGS